MTTFNIEQAFKELLNLVSEVQDLRTEVREIRGKLDRTSFEHVMDAKAVMSYLNCSRSTANKHMNLAGASNTGKKLFVLKSKLDEYLMQNALYSQSELDELINKRAIQNLRAV